MGRRSINTTKSGKYMNPTDQARKEARKKELKKNKKQRQMVRAAVLKGKDPAQLIEEMEKIDEMEYNVFQPSPLNEKVLREKRKKLKETFDRVMRLYHNDDPELWGELKRKEVEYEKRRNKKVQYYESVRHAQTVQVDEIPLPQVSDPPATMFLAGRIPLPTTTAPASSVPPLNPTPTHSILKKPTNEPIAAAAAAAAAAADKRSETKKKEPPGCPPGPPPNLETLHELDSDYEDDEPLPPPAKQIKRTKSIRFSDDTKAMDSSDSQDNDKDEGTEDVIKPTALQQKMLAISGQNIDEFMKEMENVHKKKEQERAADLQERLSTIENDNKNETDDDSESESDSSNDEDDNDDDNDEDDDEDIEDDDNNVKRREQPLDKRQDETRPMPPVVIPPPSALQSLQSQPPSLSTTTTTNAIKLPSGPPPPPVGMPPSMMFRPPPPMRPNLNQLGIRIPPGPPPGRPPGGTLPPGPPPGMPPRLGIRMPPGPPPGMPPSGAGNRPILHHHHHHHQQQQHHPHNHHMKPGGHVGGPPGGGGNIVSAAPQLTKDTKGMTTITAKPQIRNLSADVTRFVPSTLRVRREDKKVQQKPKLFVHDIKQPDLTNLKTTTKDDAYMQFMREMQGLL